MTQCLGPRTVKDDHRCMAAEFKLDRAIFEIFWEDGGNTPTGTRSAINNDRLGIAAVFLLD